VGESGTQRADAVAAEALPLTGEFFHAIDAKSRLTIPAKLREAVKSQDGGGGFFAFVDFDGILSLYTPEAYRSLAPQLHETELRAAKEVRDYKRLRYGLAEYLEVDRLGRVLLPERLVERAGLQKETAIVGCLDHVEVWDRKRWESFVTVRLPEHDGLAVQAMRLAAEKERPGEAETEPDAEADAPPDG
jgi:MraZ protein